MLHCTGIDRTLTRTRYSSSLGEPPRVVSLLEKKQRTKRVYKQEQEIQGM